MRLLTKYNTWGWILSAVVLESALECCLRRGRLFRDQVRRGFLTLTLTLSQRERGLMGCGY